MRITHVEATVRTVAVEPEYRWRDGLPPSGATTDLTVLEVRTDEGFTGVARIPRGVLSRDLVERRVAPALVGEDPMLTEHLWHLLHELDRLEHFPSYFLGPIDVALWDLKAKAAGLPLYQLLGGATRTRRAYASTVTYDSIDQYLRIADWCLERGMTAIKLHAWGEPERDIALFRALRARVGDGIDLMYDASGAFDLADAVRVGRVLDELGFRWFEEPIREDGVEAYRRLRQRTAVPILAGETSAGVHRNIADFIQSDACDLVRTGVHYKDGITGALRIAHLADAYHLRAEVHGGGLPNLHLACAIPNTSMIEVIVAGEPPVLRMAIDTDGTVTVPDAPGTGEKGSDW
jgi:L-alanine-DL-glutamate epimerase-like enolase superfamily enzyme